MKEGAIELLKFDYLIVCTGGQYGLPLRAEQAIQIEERIKYVKE